MKKSIIIFLCTLTLIFCAGCGKTDKKSEQTNNNADKQILDEQYKGLDKTALDDSMFSYPSDRRKAVVEYMRKMATVEWTPKEDFVLEEKLEGWKYSVAYTVGTTYYGLPFLEHTRGTFEEFDEYLKDGVYEGPTTLSTCIGNSCYNAVYVALTQYCPNISFKYTSDVLPANNTGFGKVGDFDDSFSNYDTKLVVNNNTMQTMAQSYAKLQMGDTIFHHIVAQDAGHARIVTGLPYVKYKQNGEIDMEQSYVPTIEQTNAFDKETIRHTTWWCDHTYTFNKLYADGYVPLTPLDYDENAKLKAVVYVKDLNNDAENFPSTGLKGSVSSNYLLNKVEIKVVNSKNETVYSVSDTPKSKNYRLKGSNFNPQKISELKNGTYTLKIDATISLGTKTVFEQKFTVK